MHGVRQSIAAPPIGIDFGTTTIRLRSFEDRKAPGDRCPLRTGIPAYVAFTPNERLVGRSAKQQAAQNPANTVSDLKRRLGQCPGSYVSYRDEMRFFRTEELVTMLLQKAVDEASHQLKARVTKAAITIPACFNQQQRQAVMIAGRAAGLDQVDLIHESTAAALAYSVRKAEDSVKALVFCLGAGGCEVAVARLAENSVKVQCVVADLTLGGREFDEQLARRCEEDIKKEYSEEFLSPQALCRLQFACAAVKEALSSASQDYIELDNLLKNQNYSSTLTVQDLELTCRSLLTRCEELVNEALAASNSPVDCVLMVGGSSRIPGVRKMLADRFGADKIISALNEDEVVVDGASMYASFLHKQTPDLEVRDVFTRVLRIDRESTPLIARNSRLRGESSNFSLDRIRPGHFRILEESFPSLTLVSQSQVFDFFIDPAKSCKSISSLVVDRSGLLRVNHEHDATSRLSTTAWETAFIDLFKENLRTLMADDDANDTKAQLRNQLQKLILLAQKEQSGNKEASKILDDHQDWLNAHAFENPETYEFKCAELEEKIKDLGSRKENEGVSNQTAILPEMSKQQASPSENEAEKPASKPAAPKQDLEVEKGQSVPDSKNGYTKAQAVEGSGKGLQEAPKLEVSQREVSYSESGSTETAALKASNANLKAETSNHSGEVTSVSHTQLDAPDTTGPQASSSNFSTACSPVPPGAQEKSEGVGAEKSREVVNQ
eukprot:Gregarina_sp_Pseudo_9__5492@NODE_705_length_2330_cov_22_809690_g666_i0_p1_GENE_NODE_705_length_2330_cov_22_809690_g666_i0NODE_705_length_2330_cov_22_809690_g666_i0_p1_ORF_typecomplete_len722_score128_28HSP70/PF00012_20/2_9e72MreB_Mbl/PF06723_13/2_1e23PilM_2/PF11104_8/0_00088FGGY_C/PF02782_16/0_0096CoA_binding_2/PF13380_6/44CoA_binding_2/PF13380_6/0_57TipAS/PF07739_13/0_34FtsA/PF14450_6/5_3e03FtsA/PF14450_6/0_88FtsA/PF14450_6/5_7e03_NODE_705_length_2330_cov_22_809690_g666_i0602225